jgi:hypothetical protein
MNVMVRTYCTWCLRPPSPFFSVLVSLYHVRFKRIDRDELINSGSDICTCRPYLIYGIEEAVKCAQRGGVGLIVYFRKEGRALGEVTKCMSPSLSPQTRIPRSLYLFFSRHLSPAPHYFLPIYPLLLKHWPPPSLAPLEQC